MKILLINNVASFHSTLAESLNKIEGIEAKYITTSQHKYIKDNQFGTFIPLYISKNTPFKYLKNKMTYKSRIKKLIDWSDVIYYLWDSLLDEEDLTYAFSKGKKIYIEWVGSDIRNPQILNQINPWFKDVFNNGYEYKDLESSNLKNQVQIKFAKYKAQILSTPEMKLYINKDLFPDITTIFQRIDITQFTPKYPEYNVGKKVKIVHSPSAPVAKGSKYIIAAIEELKKSFDIDFVFLTNMAREDVLKEMQSADIFVDQIICGSYGMATCEAMAFGKPVFCYLLPELYELGLPMDCPIINVNPSNIEKELRSVLSNLSQLNTIGIKSRQYVENYHNSDKIALYLVDQFKAKFQ